LDIDPELMYSVLKAPENVGKSRMVRSVRAKCIGIKNNIQNYNEEELVDSLKHGFVKTLGIKLEDGILSDQEIELAGKLVIKKYSNLNWLKKYE
ncbi:MAG: hypothetical protein ACFE8C_08225, partial [Promethearchaeota archaeon]